MQNNATKLIESSVGSRRRDHANDRFHQACRIVRGNSCGLNADDFIKIGREVILRNVRRDVSHYPGRFIK